MWEILNCDKRNAIFACLQFYFTVTIANGTQQRWPFWKRVFTQTTMNKRQVKGFVPSNEWFTRHIYPRIIVFHVNIDFFFQIAFAYPLRRGAFNIFSSHSEDRNKKNTIQIQCSFKAVNLFSIKAICLHIAFSIKWNKSIVNNKKTVIDVNKYMNSSQLMKHRLSKKKFIFTEPSFWQLLSEIRKVRFSNVHCFFPFSRVNENLAIS